MYFLEKSLVTMKSPQIWLWISGKVYIQLRVIQDANCVCFLFFCLTSEGGVKGQAEPRQVLCDVSWVRTTTDDSILNGALVLCNPATLGPSDSDARNPQPQGGFHLAAAAPQQGRDEDASQPEDGTSQMSEKCCAANPGKRFLWKSMW